MRCGICAIRVLALALAQRSSVFVYAQRAMLTCGERSFVVAEWESAVWDGAFDTRNSKTATEAKILRFLMSAE